MKPPIFYRRYDYDKSKLPNPQLAKLEEGVTTLEQARERSGATIGYPGWGLLYYLLSCHLDPSREETIIETGTNWGCTTIVLAQALVDAGVKGRVITFELEPENIEIARRNLEAAGLSERVEIVQGNSLAQLGPRIESLGEIRFALLDASHLYNDALTEFEVISEKLTSDAIVVFDNTYLIAEEGEDPRVNGTLKTIKERFGGNLINLEFVSWYTPGLAVWQKTPKL